MVLKYRYTRHNKPEVVEERVSLDWTKCHYGGERPWLKCPRCGRRVSILALGGMLFLCRHCYRIKYASQLETEMDRANRKLGKLQERLGDKTWERPKGMHKTTFYRLLGRIDEARRQADKIFAAKALKFLERREKGDCRRCNRSKLHKIIKSAPSKCSSCQM